MDIIHQDELTEGEQVPSSTKLFIFLQAGHHLQLKLTRWVIIGSSLVWAPSLESFLGQQQRGKW